ncbi:outer membrane beta-barrel protein [Nevskia sp.]|uniref:outer membrane beta-barrel protein n=1 Tax=Nevskia sp. TaxID=1929292 RepID=UPI0025FF3B79|nr:outer membrane beta-barrel protein [Nevskia sp.]
MSNFKKLLSVAGLACLPGVAFADTPSIGSILEASGVKVSGYTSASYSLNFNDGKTLAYRAYDAQTDTFTIDQASLTIGYAPESGFGATVNILAGEDSNVINANYGDGDSIFSLPTAYVSYAGGGFTVIAGRFGSLAGYEVTADNAAPFISRSWLFQNTQPFFHTGVRVSYAFSSLVSATLGAVNSAPQASTIDANKQKTLEANLTLTPTKSLLVSLTNYLGVDDFDGVVLFPINGPAGGAFTTRTNISDIVVQYTGIDKLTLALNGDIQDAKGLYINKGIAFYGMYQLTDQFAARARFELTEASLKASLGGGTDSFKIFTIAGVYSPSSHMDLIAEARFDTSNNDVFPNGATLKDNGGNFAVKAIYKF